MDELREKIARKLADLVQCNWENFNSSVKEEFNNCADQILALIKEEGWKSPEDMQLYKQFPSNFLGEQALLGKALRGIGQEVDDDGILHYRNPI